VQNHHLSVKYHQLVPNKGLSMTDKVSLHDNLIIHGDNLRALKALLPTYSGKIKCIYIDPPYNTGKDEWKYNDDVNSPMIREWLGKVVDKEDLTRHEKWLCMMMPRLKLLRELLAEDGIIFTSLDNNEFHHYRTLADEVFGEENFLGTLIIETATDNNPSQITTEHEYITCYCKNITLQDKWSAVSTNAELLVSKYSELKKKYKSDTSKIQVEIRKWIKENLDQLDKVSHYDNVDERGLFHDGDVANTKFGGYNYRVVHPVTKKPCKVPEKGFRFPEATMMEMIRNDDIMFGDDETTLIKPKKRIETVVDRLRSVIYEDGRAATKELEQLFHKDFFKNPKSTRILKRLFRFTTSDDDIVLDSFAGSGTTAHSILELNLEDGGNRRFILVEMEEYANKITAERVRRVIKGVKTAIDTSIKTGLGGSFSYFELGEPIEMESLLQGKNFPSYKEFARYLFYTATGEEFNEKAVDEKSGLIGESKNYEVYLFYKPDLAWLKTNALTLERVRALPKFKKKKRLVFAPAKYVDDHTLSEHRVDFCQLPYEIYRLQK
jgi:adenine-specific DNA-methyltransferase